MNFSKSTQLPDFFRKPHYRDDMDGVPGNTDVAKDKIAGRVKVVVGRNETAHSLVSGWVGPHGIMGLLAGEFGKLFRKYYYVVAADQGVGMLRRTGFLGGRISESQLIPYNQIINVTYKKGFGNSWVIIRTTTPRRGVYTRRMRIWPKASRQLRPTAYRQLHSTKRHDLVSPQSAYSLVAANTYLLFRTRASGGRWVRSKAS
jgi:hypothetical protein